MKKIIAATDFSAPAENAMMYAAGLAGRIKASVLLVHVYQIPVSMNDVPVLVISPEEMKQSAENGLARAREILRGSHPDLEVTVESRLGDVVDELNDLSNEHDTLAVVVGKHGANGLERILFGSTSLSIIRHSKVPVIAVPHSTSIHSVSGICLAVDQATTMEQINAVQSFAGAFSAQLHLVHVHPVKGAEQDKGLYDQLNAKVHTVVSDEFMKGIQSYVSEHNIDLLVIMPHKHSLMEKLFFKTHTDELVQKLPIPLMCMNDD
jgi:nucleotide-binding universal stress UspA family protein